MGAREVDGPVPAVPMHDSLWVGGSSGDDFECSFNAPDLGIAAGILLVLATIVVFGMVMTVIWLGARVAGG